MSSRSVPFFDYPRLYADDKDRILEIVDDVGLRGAFIMQQDLAAFEKKIAAFVGTSFSVGVGNATDGLELSWLALGLKPGDEVIVSAHTMVATASAIVVAGGTPVPVDIGPDGLIDPEAVAAAIGPRTAGIMPTQLNGRVCDMEPLLALVERHGLALVEDAAQALGAKYRGRSAGTFGSAASFSFFPAKVLGCLGDGGIVVTSDEEVFRQVFMLHDHGRLPDTGEVHRWGRNSRLDNLQAAILLDKLTKYPEVIARRRQIASMYDEQLRGLEQIDLPPAPDSEPDHFDVFQNYEISVDNRDGLRDYLQGRGVGTLIQWGGKALNHFEGLGLGDSDVPNSDEFFNRCLMLPMNVFLSDDDVMYVSDCILDFYSGSHQ